jgi:hypothetical protein
MKNPNNHPVVTYQNAELQKAQILYKINTNPAYTVGLI